MKKKILFLVQVPPPIHGASLRNLSLYKSRLLNDSFNLELLPLSFSESIEDLGKLKFAKALRLISLIKSLLSILLISQIDVVYFTISARKLGLLRDSLLVSIIKCFGIDIVFHLRNKGFSNYNSGIWPIILKFVFRDSKIIVLSESMIYDVERYAVESQIFVVNNGIADISSGIPLEKDESSINLLYVSHLRRSKGILEVIDSFEYLLKSYDNIALTVVGDDGDLTISDLISMLERKRISHAVRVLGPLYGREKAIEYSKADIFVFPTYYYNEIFPGVILEAMSFGLPVVTTDEGGILDIITDERNGLIIEKRNVASLSKALKMLIDSKSKRAQIGSMARSDYLSRYTQENFEKNMNEILKKC